jgi:hypothetical protein
MKSEGFKAVFITLVSVLETGRWQCSPSYKLARCQFATHARWAGDNELGLR